MLGPGAPKLNLTTEEKHVYGQLFRLADTDNVGVVTGEVAVKFFEKTRLDSRVLGEVGGPLASINCFSVADSRGMERHAD